MQENNKNKFKLSLKLAEQHLKAKDKVLNKIIHKEGPCRLALKQDAFQSLVESVIHQQLSIQAASTIFTRFRSLYPGRAFPTPDEVLRTPTEKLRDVGVSNNKIRYLQDLSRNLLDGVIAPRKFINMSDEEIIINLTQVKGIGRWTAEMFLIFSLGRFNVLPVDDVGLQRAVQLHYGSRYVSSEMLKRIGKKWEPYCTVATWYLWESLNSLRQ